MGIYLANMNNFLGNYLASYYKIQLQFSKWGRRVLRADKNQEFYWNENNFVRDIYYVLIKIKYLPQLYLYR